VIERDRGCSKTTDDLAAWNAFGCTDTRVLDAALDWYDAGYTPIPCLPRSKQAAIRWRHWQERRPTRAEVVGWFWNHPQRNVALVCGGTSHLAVLDFDRRPEYFRWRQRCRIETFTTCTARGFHVYVRADNLPARSFALDGIDVKTTGYVLVPPSTHPTGVSYEVFTDAEIARVTDLADVLPELAELPETASAEHRTGYGEGVSAPARLCYHLPAAAGAPPSPIPGPRENGKGLIGAVKRALPILALVGRYTAVRSSSADGRWYSGRCPHPMHEDTSPSFWVDASRGRCGCHAPSCPIHRYRGGLALDVVDFYACLSGLSLSEALRILRREVGL